MKNRNANSPRRPLCMMVLPLMLCLSTTAIAQDAALGAAANQAIKPEGLRQYLPKYEPQEQRDLVLPRLAPAPSVGATALSSGPRVKVRKIVLTGNTVYTPADFATILSRYEGRDLTNEDLQRLRQELTLHYVTAGYINSGAVIPDQDLNDGLLTIRIVEGVVTDIEVLDNPHLADGFIKKRFELGVGPPLNVNELEQRLQIMLQSPFLDQVNAELVPGVAPGQAQLRARVKESERFLGSISYANDRSPAVSGERVSVNLTTRNLTGWGEIVSAAAGKTGGLEDYSASASIPVTRYDTILSVSGNLNKSDVVEEPLNILDINSETRSVEVNLTHPFYKTARQEFSAGVGVARRHSETFLLGRPFSFTSGRESNVTDISVVRFTQSWLDRSQEQVVALSSTFNLGIDAFGADAGGAEPNGKFLTWLGQGQIARRVPLWDSQIIARVAVQFAPEAVPSIERFVIGGDGSVRGYRTNLLVRDQGVVASLESRIPLFSLPIRGISKEPNEGLVELAPFVDYGRGWNKVKVAGEQKNLVSVGVGLRWALGKLLHAELYGGVALKKASSKGNDIQDSGIHFRITSFVF